MSLADYLLNPPGGRGASALTPEGSREVLEDFAALDVTRYLHLPLVERIWTLRHTLSAF